MTVTERKRLNNPNQPVGRWIRVDKRLAVYLRDRFTCLYCLKDLHGADPRDVTLDHVIPQADGGSHEADNLVTCCRACNSARQDTPLRRFCGPDTRKHVRRNLRRNLTPYRTLAKAILAGEVGYEEALK